MFIDPNDIERFGLLRYVAPEKIDFGEYKTANLGVILPNGLILINSSNSLEGQVQTVLHEIIHMHPEFISYTRGLWEGSIVRNEEYERRIEELAQRVYSQKKDIVDYIVARLGEAHAHPRNF